MILKAPYVMGALYNVCVWRPSPLNVRQGRQPGEGIHGRVSFGQNFGYMRGEDKSLYGLRGRIVYRGTRVLLFFCILLGEDLGDCL